MDSMPDRDILLDAMLEHSADNIYFKDTEGRFICGSHSLARWFGLLNVDALIGRTDRDFFSAEHARQAAEDEATVMRTGQPIQGKIEKETWPNGEVTWVSTSKLPLYDREGNLIGIQGISRDVTVQHRASEELSRLARTLSERNLVYEQDIKLASEGGEFFGSALPAVLPPGATPETARVRCASFYQPTAALGGDFYLFLSLSDDRTRILVCDVMGHGMQAALVAMLLRTWAQQLSPTHASPAVLMQALNQRLSDAFLSQEVTFMATAVVMDLDVNSGALELVCAGHLAPLIYSTVDRSVKPLYPNEQNGPALGLFPHSGFVSLNTTWQPGDKILLYTDGLVECRDQHGDEFDERRLIYELARNGSHSLTEIVHHIIASARSHSGDKTFDDDVCVIMLERLSP